VFYHWRRAADEGQDYPFARFNKVYRICLMWHKLGNQLLNNQLLFCSSVSLYMAL